MMKKMKNKKLTTPVRKISLLPAQKSSINCKPCNREDYDVRLLVWK